MATTWFLKITSALYIWTYWNRPASKVPFEVLLATISDNVRWIEDVCLRDSYRFNVKFLGIIKSNLACVLVELWVHFGLFWDARLRRDMDRISSLYLTCASLFA